MNDRVERPRPLASAAGRAPYCTASAPLVDSDTVTANLGAIQCFSRKPNIATEGLLSVEESRSSKIRVKIRPSVFVVETDPSYTIEEVSTKKLTALLEKRVEAFCACAKTVGESAVGARSSQRRAATVPVTASALGADAVPEAAPPNDRQMLKHLMECGERATVESSISPLERVAEMLPVVINLDDWAVSREREIVVDIKGDEGVEQLLTISDINPENWEMDRATALVIDRAHCVFYARHNMLDVVLTRSHNTGLPLRQPIVFRLGGFKVWLITPLQLALPKGNLECLPPPPARGTIGDGPSGEAATTARLSRTLHQHPSLTAPQDLRDVAAQTETISGLLIPGVTRFRPAELEALRRGAEREHYFTAKCFYSKDTLSLDKFVDAEHRRWGVPSNHAQALHSPPRGSAIPSGERAAKAQASSASNDLEGIARELSAFYSSERAVTRESTATDSPGGSPGPRPTPSVSFEAPVSCFFGPEYDSVVDCIASGGDRPGLQMHLFPAALGEPNLNRTLVATPSNRVHQIHESGRFMNLPGGLVGFVPDLGADVLKWMMAGAGDPRATADLLASVLFYNNVDIAASVVSVTGSDSLADVISEFLAASVASDAPERLSSAARLVGEMAAAVAATYGVVVGRAGRDSCGSILFPSTRITDEREACGRHYKWSDPLTCVVNSHRAVMDAFLRAVRGGATVDRDDRDWSFMHDSVLRLLLEPFFEAALSSGAWAVREVRTFMKWVVDETALRYTSSQDQHAALALGQLHLDTMARLSVHWAIAQSASENSGVCTAFAGSGPFVVEPDLAPHHYRLSSAPRDILQGEDVAARLRAHLEVARRLPAEVPPSVRARAVHFSLPTAAFMGSAKDLHVAVNVVLSDAEEQGNWARKRARFGDGRPTPEAKVGVDLGAGNATVDLGRRDTLQYSGPEILRASPRYVADRGFADLRDRGLLRPSYRILCHDQDPDTKTDACRWVGRPETANRVDGVLLGMTTDGRLAHVSLRLPGSGHFAEEDSEYGSGRQPFSGVERQSKIVLQDGGVEAVLYEPLLSSLSLERAARNKRADFGAADIFGECLAPLITGRLDIFPRSTRESPLGTGSLESSAEGFDWLWRTTQKRHGVPVELERPRCSGRTEAVVSFWRRKRVVLTSEDSVVAVLRIAVSQLESRSRPLETLRGGRRPLAAPRSSPSSPSHGYILPAPADMDEPDLEPSLAEIETFLKQHMKNMLAFLVCRMTMVVSPNERRVIADVAGKVTRVVLDSFYIALDPTSALAATLVRISGEQSGVVVDSSGTYSLGATALRGAPNVFGFSGGPSTQDVREHTDNSVSRLERTLRGMSSVGTNGERSRTPPTGKERRAEGPTEWGTAEERARVHALRDENVGRSSEFTARLVGLMRDSDKGARLAREIARAAEKMPRIPPVVAESMPAPEAPTTPGRVSARACDENFSRAQELFVPVNPRHLLTDTQWIECLSAVETATRDSARAAVEFDARASQAERDLEELLREWRAAAGEVISEHAPEDLSGLKVDFFNREASRIARARALAERSKVAITTMGKVVNLEKYGLLAVARSLIDVDFYAKIPNFWQGRDWRGLLYHAVSMVSLPLEENIARGFIAASQLLALNESSLALAEAEEAARVCFRHT
uniref:Wsv289-like protein n=1 Tax=Sicyonia whispovirus TaxID=2984283 RepID=A0A9C7C0B2_9VIRU|nr:MAG: wsv289-like protein [Sicyonia whispovirus]